jgi:hypothetical protein
MKRTLALLALCAATLAGAATPGLDAPPEPGPALRHRGNPEAAAPR